MYIFYPFLPSSLSLPSLHIPPSFVFLCPFSSLRVISPRLHLLASLVHLHFIFTPPRFLFPFFHIILACHCNLLGVTLFSCRLTLPCLTIPFLSILLFLREYLLILYMFLSPFFFLFSLLYRLISIFLSFLLSSRFFLLFNCLVFWFYFVLSFKIYTLTYNSLDCLTQHHHFLSTTSLISLVLTPFLTPRSPFNLSSPVTFTILPALHFFHQFFYQLLIFLHSCLNVASRLISPYHYLSLHYL